MTRLFRGTEMSQSTLPHHRLRGQWAQRGTIGAAALAGTAASSAILRSTTSRLLPIVLGLAFVGAYAAYETVLFAITAALGGADAFTLAIVPGSD